MIDQTDGMSVVQQHRGDAVVIPVERANVAWPQISTYPQRDVSPSAMGKASSFALGVCLAQPDTKVIIFDGDGSLEMNLGTLVTIPNEQPRCLYHPHGEKKGSHPCSYPMVERGQNLSRAGHAPMMERVLSRREILRA